MDGYAVLTELRKKDPKNLLPIILVSAKNASADIVRGFSLQCNDYVSGRDPSVITTSKTDEIFQRS